MLLSRDISIGCSILRQGFVGLGHQSSRVDCLPISDMVQRHGNTDHVQRNQYTPDFVQVGHPVARHSAESLTYSLFLAVLSFPSSTYQVFVNSVSELLLRLRYFQENGNRGGSRSVL